MARSGFDSDLVMTFCLERQTRELLKSCQMQAPLGRAGEQEQQAARALRLERAIYIYIYIYNIFKLLFIIRFAVFLFFGSSSDPKNKKVLDPKTNPGFLN